MAWFRKPKALPGPGTSRAKELLGEAACTRVYPVCMSGRPNFSTLFPPAV